MKQWVIGIGLSSLVMAVPVGAETLDGAKILEQEAEKARQIEDLEYQAKLIEQKAKLAKAYKELQESGGVIPGEAPLGVAGGQGSATTSNTGSSTSSVTKDISQLPQLKSISGSQALFEFRGQLFRAVPGGQLPGGFKVLSVNETNGVRLQHNGDIYSVDIAWASDR